MLVGAALWLRKTSARRVWPGAVIKKNGGEMCVAWCCD
jgi:predicted DNA-binding transcriptional regulator YafY